MLGVRHTELKAKMAEKGTQAKKSFIAHPAEARPEVRTEQFAFANVTGQGMDD